MRCEKGKYRLFLLANNRQNLLLANLFRKILNLFEDKIHLTMRTLIIVCATILIAQGTAGMSCNTTDIATCFASVADGGVIDLAPGTMSSGDGISAYAQFYMQDKHVTIACNGRGETCTLKGASGKGVVRLKNNRGTTILARLIIRDGDNTESSTSYGDSGGGLYVSYSTSTSLCPPSLTTTLATLEVPFTLHVTVVCIPAR